MSLLVLALLVLALTVFLVALLHTHPFNHASTSDFGASVGDKRPSPWTAHAAQRTATPYVIRIVLTIRDPAVARMDIVVTQKRKRSFCTSLLVLKPFVH